MPIDTRHTIEAAEHLLGELDGRQTDTILRIATKSRAAMGGGAAAMLQALITWAQQQQGPAVLKTFAENSTDPQIEELTRHLVGLCASLVSDKALSKADEIIQKPLRDLGLARLKRLQGESAKAASRGPQVELICADHLGHAWPTTLYERQDGKLRSELAFRDLATAVLRQAEAADLSNDERGTPSHSGLVQAAGDALYELFRNTHEHALKDIAGNYLKKSLRGVHIRRFGLLKEHLIDAVIGSPPLVTYCQRLRPKVGGKQIHLVEFSVFDSGPGLAARWREEAGRDISPDDELQAISACFRLHATTKNISGRGMGLPLVVDALRSRGGFLRIRTGRQSLYADLAANMGAAYGTPPEFRPWSDRKNLAFAGGTLFTFLVPLVKPE